MYMATLAAISLLSITGICALFLRHVREVDRMTPEEVAGVLQRERPLSTQAGEVVVRGVRILWYRYMRDRLFLFIVKQISRLRIWALRSEQWLFKINTRMRERVKVSRAPSAYWQEIHGWRKTVHWHRKNAPAGAPEKE